MEANKLDQLFRNKIKQAKKQPGDDSWNKLEAMLDQKEQKKPKMIWRVAASIVLLLASIAAFQLFLNDELNGRFTERSVVSLDQMKPLTPETRVHQAIDLDMVRVTIEQVDITIPDVIEAPQEEVILVAEATTPEQPIIEEEIFIEAFTDDEFETLLASVEIEEEQPIIPEKQLKQIKITYKRNPVLANPNELVATAEPDSTKKGLKKLWEKSKEIDAGNLWADLRDAKDNLFARSDKKKNNVKNLSN